MQLIALAIALVVTLLVLRVLSRGPERPSIWIIGLALFAGVVASAVVSPLVTESSYRSSLTALALSAPLTLAIAVLVWWKLGAISRRSPTK